MAPQLRDHERYSVLGEHGRGGLGRVSRAYDRELGRDIAIKELISRSQAGEVRFLREALITARLEHPGIVPVYEAGRWPDGTPFYAMKLVSGRPLRDLIAERKTVDERIGLLHHVIAVADAIAYAHGRNIIHRDLKPSNVIVGDFGETVVIDWGLAKDLTGSDEVIATGTSSRDSHDDGLTSAGAILGTPAYMAPEQERGDAVDQRADVFAIGAMLWELCSLEKVPPSEARLRHLVPRKGGIDKDLATIVEKALHREPAGRYQTARELGDDLRRYTRRERVSARRYSLFARFTLIAARHRTIMLSASVGLAALTVTLALSLIKISAESRNAIVAREAAENSNAAALLSRDPTAAWSALSNRSSDPPAALLRARIQAAGVAGRSVHLPASVLRQEGTADGRRVVLSKSDRILRTVDSRTGMLTTLVDGLTEPPMWTSTLGRVYFVHQTSRLSIATVDIGAGMVTELAPLDELPLDIKANESGVFWLATDRQLYSATPDRSPRVIGREVQRFVLFGERLAICYSDGSLRVGVPGALGELLGRCQKEGLWNSASNGFLYANDSALYIFQDGQLRSLALAGSDPLVAIKLTETGLAAGFNSTGHGLILRPGATAFERVALAGRPLNVVARDDTVAWPLQDGSIRILDAKENRETWLQAHPEEPWCVALYTNRFMMTCGRQDIRFWQLSPLGHQSIADLSSQVDNVVFNAAGDALLDGIDGSAYVILHNEKHAIVVHKHAGPAFGVAWCDDQACSTGWDGKVLCTDTHSGQSRVAAALHSVTPWLTAAGGHCYTAAAKGGIYDVRSPDNPMYAHHHEPYRFAASQDGRFVASGDWGGDVIVYDTARARVAATSEHAHAGRVTAVAWAGGQLFTAGTDGELHITTAELSVVKRLELGQPILYLAASGGTIGVGLDDGSLWLFKSSGDVENHVVTGATISTLAVSPEGTSLAAGTTDGEVFVMTTDHRVAAARFEHGRISCVGFETEDLLLVCAPSGRVIHTSLNALSFNSD